jgi:primosomal replication protein N
MYHTLIIVGNVGKDPEMRYTPSGQAVTSFSVATNRQYTTGNGEQVKETIWFRVTTWGKQAEVCNQYVKKGMKVLVEGRLTPDKATGGPRVWTKNDFYLRVAKPVAICPCTLAWNPPRCPQKTISHSRLNYNRSNGCRVRPVRLYMDW